MAARDELIQFALKSFLLVVTTLALRSHDQQLERERTTTSRVVSGGTNDPLKLSPLWQDPPDQQWRAEPCSPRLRCDPQLEHPSLRLGTRRSSERGDAIDYEAYERISARMLRHQDGTHTLVVAGLNFRDGETWSLTLTRDALGSPLLRGEFQASSLEHRHRTEEMHGTLTLSAIPNRDLDQLHFELRARVSPNWEIHAEGPVEITSD
jgi:hypothetical protein